VPPITSAFEESIFRLPLGESPYFIGLPFQGFEVAQKSQSHSAVSELEYELSVKDPLFYQSYERITSRYPDLIVYKVSWPLSLLPMPGLSASRSKNRFPSFTPLPLHRVVGLSLILSFSFASPL